MNGEWTTTTLGKVLELKRGYDLPQQERSTGSVPIISSSGISGLHSEAKVQGPGVVTGRYGTIGEVHYVDQDFWPLNTTLYVRDFKGNNPRFVAYFLRLIRFSDYSDKGAVPGINRNDLHMAPVLWPGPAEQTAIANVLASFDDKIALNQKMSLTLAAIAKALFQSWFVDFDPLRQTNASGSTKYLVDAASYPNQYGEDGLPKGWTRKALSTIVDLQREMLEPSSLEREKVLHFSLPAYDLGQGPIVEQASCIKSNKLVVRRGTILFSKLNPQTPRVWIVPETRYQKMLASTEFVAMSPADDIPMSYVWSLLSSAAFQARAAALVTGTSKSHQRVQPGALLATEWPLPPPSVLTAFDSFVQPIMLKIEAIQCQSSTLAALRDTLLPKLVSGALRIKTTEAIPENG